MRVTPSLLSILAVGTVSQARFLVGESDLLASYDYIVVGAGTAGATVASRLSETNATVLLIEAGTLDQGEDAVLIPRQAGYAMSTIYDWNFTSLAMPTMNNRTIGIPQGKVIGGSSVLNGMAFDRGAASDYDAWVDLGNPGWGWTDLLPYFKKSEKFTPPDAEAAAKYNITWDPSAHGTEGPIHASYPTIFSSLVDYYFRAFKSLNIPKELDGNNGRAINAFWAPNALHATKKVRSYSRAYVELAIDRTNFHVLTGRQVTKLVSEKVGTSIHITGVEFAVSSQGPRTTVKVNKEVILSGGVIGSPRLLQLSGIGPAPVLQKANVTVVIDLPGVGTNYQDHAFQFSRGAFLSPPPDPTFTDDQARELYITNKTGPWTTSGPISFGFIPLLKMSDRTQQILTAATAQTPEQYLAPGSHASVIAGYDVQKKVLVKHLGSDLMAAVEYMLGGGIATSQMHPFSRGFVQIDTSDPFVYPSIDLRYNTNPLDLDITVDGLRFVRKIMATPVVAPLGWTEGSPGPSLTTDVQLKGFLASTQSTMFHSCCTNPMQPLAQGGVVDAKLKVFGTTNLRVVDISIAPLIPGTHLQSTAYAIGEKAADLIKADATA